MPTPGRTRKTAAPPPVVVFGALDRHKLGDLRAVGGDDVQALPDLATCWREGPALLWHVSGELLTCRAWQAAVMQMEPAHAAEAAPYLLPSGYAQRLGAAPGTMTSAC
jgi:hypothetical protein